MAVSTASTAAILLIATAGGLAIESRPALPATIRSAARHYHDPSLDSSPALPRPPTSSPTSMAQSSPSPSLPSSLPQIEPRTAGTLAIEPSPISLAKSRPIVHHRLSSEPGSLPGPCVPLDLLADANDTALASASNIAAADTLAIEPSPIPLAKSRPVAHHHQHLEPEPILGLPAPLGPFADASDLFADANDTILTFASIIATAVPQTHPPSS